MEFFVYIDDTAFAGNSKHKLIDKSTVAWVGIILSEQQNENLKNLIQIYADNCNPSGVKFSEFHFKDIYGARGEFKNFSMKNRLTIVNSFVQIYNNIIPRCLISKADDSTLKMFSDKFKQKRINNLFLGKSKDYALYQLLLMIMYITRVMRKDYFMMIVELM
jgi:hypothetical protein